MLKVRTMIDARRPMKGFSLIELMIAMALGLILLSAALVLIVAINQANSETIQSTRLTQELRTLAAVIADDVKRARRVDDPIANIGQGTTVACATTPKTPAQPCYPFIPATNNTASCAAYGYTGTTATPTLYNYHSIRRVVTGSVGSVEIAQRTFDPNVAAGTNLPVITSCPVTGGGTVTTTLSSTQLDITALTFTTVSPYEIDLTISGRFLAGDTYTKTITRTFTQPIFIRSVSVN